MRSNAYAGEDPHATPSSHTDTHLEGNAREQPSTGLGGSIALAVFCCAPLRAQFGHAHLVLLGVYGLPFLFLLYNENAQHIEEEACESGRREKENLRGQPAGRPWAHDHTIRCCPGTELKHLLN